MAIIRKLRVNGALYTEVSPPAYEPRMNRYVGTIEHDNGNKQQVYSRLPAGPFVFTIPAPEHNQ